MQLSDKQKKQILEGLIDILPRIANKKYQKKIWIQGEGPEVDDFDDTVCDFFGECDSILENYKDFGITETQYMLLKKLRDHFRFFADNNDFPEEFIDTAEWANIMDLAKEVLKAFDHPKSKS